MNVCTSHPQKHISYFSIEEILPRARNALKALILALLIAVALCVFPACSDDSPTEVSSSKDITAFSFLQADNPMLSGDASAVIDGPNGLITIDVPRALPCNEYLLAATFSTTGETVHCRGQIVVNGETGLYYAPQQVLTVKAKDGSTKDYSVLVVQTLDAFVANGGTIDQPNMVLNNVSGTFADSGQLLGASASSDAALGDLRASLAAEAKP